MATLTVSPVGNGSLEYERATTVTELFPLIDSVRPQASDAIQRIWGGERDRQSLCAGKSDATGSFIEMVLSQLDARNGGGGGAGGGVGDGGAGGGGARVSDEDIAILVGFTGKSEEQCRMCLEAAGGDREKAGAMLLGA